MIRRILARLYYRIFPLRKKIKDYSLEIEKLTNQLEYFKKHCDIRTLKPATGMLRELQLNNLSYIKELLMIFEKDLKIQPFLEGGALLGYVRHNGFIPWDDDVDLGLLREDYEKLIEYSKNHFHWYDAHYIQENAYLEFDKIIRQHPDEYIAIQTPYCLHIYRGKDVTTAYNAEFFPWDFVKENISDLQLVNYAKEYKKTVCDLHTWDKVFKYLEAPETFEKVFSKNHTDLISPGIGHWDLAKQTIRGAHKMSDVFPLKKVVFEGQEINIPNNSEKYLELAYGDYMSYPDDFGISHNLEEMEKSVSK